MFTSLISLMKLRLLTLTKIIRYFYFQPLFITNLWRLFSKDTWKVDLRLVATFDKFLENLGFLVAHITIPRVTYKKYATRLLDVVVVLILRVCAWQFKFPVKRSRPYTSCGCSRGLIRAHFCFALRITLFHKAIEDFFHLHAVSSTYGGLGQG